MYVRVYRGERGRGNLVYFKDLGHVIVGAGNSVEQEDRLEAYPRPGIAVLFLPLKDAWRQTFSFSGACVFSRRTSADRMRPIHAAEDNVLFKMPCLLIYTLLTFKDTSRHI